MPDIFVSYSRKDQEWVGSLVRVLKEEGWDVWWDTSMRVGERYDKAIAEALANASAVVAVWSPRSLESSWVKDEAGEGGKRGKLIPITLGGAEPPLGFRQYHTVDLTGWTSKRDDPRLQDLLFALESLIKGAGIPPEFKPLRSRARRYVHRVGVPLVAIISVSAAMYAAMYYAAPEFVRRLLPWNMGFNVYEGLSILDVGGQTVSDVSFEECQARCSDDPDCKAVSYLAANRACFLKPFYNQVVRDERVKSGVRAILKPPKRPET